MMYPEIQATADAIGKLGNPVRIYLISRKTNPVTQALTSFKLALVVSDDTSNISELECYLYSSVDCEYPYDLILYKQSEWDTLSEDPRTFAWAIKQTGSVLYG